MKNLRKKIDKILISVSMVCMELPIQTYATAARTNDNFMEKFQVFINEYEPFVNGALGLLLLASIANFFYNVVMLNHNADNPQKRHESIHNLLVSGGMLAIQGSISLFIMLYFYFFGA